MKYSLILILLAVSFSTRAQSRGRTENVFIITLDGYRWQELFTGADSALIQNEKYIDNAEEIKSRFWTDSPERRRKKLMPFFWSTLATQGQLYGNRVYGNKVNCSNTKWFSYPGYNEILCGYADDDRIKSNDKIDNPNVTVLEFLNNTKLYKGKVAGFSTWDVTPFIINETRSKIPFNGGYDLATETKLSDREIFLNELQQKVPGLSGSVREDAFTHLYALEYLKKHQPKVVFISYGETDEFAHSGRYDEYLKSAYRTDQFIQELWQWAQSQTGYRNKTTLIITTDHGRGILPVDKWRSHGGVPGADQIWLAVIGPDTPATGEQTSAGQVFQNQIAKTAAAFLGINYVNEKKVGDVIGSALQIK